MARQRNSRTVLLAQSFMILLWVDPQEARRLTVLSGNTALPSRDTNSLLKSVSSKLPPKSPALSHTNKLPLMRPQSGTDPTTSVSSLHETARMMEALDQDKIPILGITSGLSNPALQLLASEPCPVHPLDLCDFYIEGSRDLTPLLQIPNATGATPAFISGPIRDAHRASEDPLGAISVQSSSSAKFLCPAPEGTEPDGSNGPLGGAFSVANDEDGRAKVQVGSLEGVNATALESRCVLLPLRELLVTPTDNIPTSLYPGDGNQLYFEDRRCLVIQIGPEAPTCPAPLRPTSLPPCAPPAPVNPPSPEAQAFPLPQVYEVSSPPPPVESPPPLESPPMEPPYVEPPHVVLSPVQPPPPLESPPVEDTPTAPSEVAPLPLAPAAPVDACSNPCPDSPSELCDFFFEGSADTVPTFSLGGLQGDQIISPAIQVNPEGTVITIEVDSTNLPATPLGCKAGDFGNQFYSTGQQAHVLVRTFQNGIAPFVDQCVKLPLTAVQIVLPPDNAVVNLNPGDKNGMFPEPRRCVVFRTSE